MATRTSTITKPGPNFSLQLAVWTGLLNGDDGTLFEFVDWADRCFQVFGTFGAGGTIVMEGSNDGTNWSTMTDASGVAMSYTAASVKQMTEAPRYVRPRVTAGDGTTNLTASVLARRMNSIA